MVKILEKEDQLSKVKAQVENFLNDTLEARQASERDRDYYDGYQWSDEEVKALQRRNQAAIVVNRVKPKVEGLKGLLAIRKTDIKAFPRNPGHDVEAAHAVTDGLRYVFDNNDLDSLQMKVFEDVIVEGYGATIVQAELSEASEIEIKLDYIPWDRFYFDPHSRKLDFSDARFMGQMIWMDQEQLIEYFPEKEAEIKDMVVANNNLDETLDDRPRWSTGNNNRKRFRVAQHFFIKAGVWHETIFTDDIFFVEPQPSSYLNEFGKPECPIVATTAYIDRNNKRYGEVRSFIDQQDEINHRRSKALHLLSSRQTVSRKGAVEDIEALKRELSKPNGHIEYNGEKGDFDILSTSDFTQGQFELYQDAKAELDATSLNAQLSGERQSGDLSGKAIDRLQSAGAMEVNSLFMSISKWKKEAARKSWARIKQFWDTEKWIRVTDDQDNLRHAGLNTQITTKQFLEEIINDESKSLEMRLGATASLQVMLQQNDPRLQQVVEVRNKITELDVDVILEESFDVVNVQNEQFQTLAQFAQSSKDIDIIELIELSQIRKKEQLIEKIESRRAAAAQATGNIAQIEAQEKQVKNAKTFADAQLSTKKAEQLGIENQLLVSNPPQQVNSVSI